MNARGYLVCTDERWLTHTSATAEGWDIALETVREYADECVYIYLHDGTFDDEGDLVIGFCHSLPIPAIHCAPAIPEEAWQDMLRLWEFDAEQQRELEIERYFAN